MDNTAPHSEIPLLDPHLRDLSSRLDGLSDRARSLRAAYSDAQLLWKPDPATWNMGQCLEHLIRTDRVYIPAVLESLQQVRASGIRRNEPYAPTWLGGWFIRMMQPGRGPSLKTFRSLAPATEHDDLTVFPRFVDHQVEMQALLREADGWDLNAGRFASPLVRLVRLTLGEALTMLVVHQERHLQQAERLARRSGFPSGDPAA